MSKRKVYIFILPVLIISIIIYIIIDFERINSFKNDIKNRYFFSPAADSDEFKIIDPARFSKYKKTYRDIPPAYTHFGNFLFYNARKGESIRDIASLSVRYTHYYKSYKLQNAIMEYNGIKSGIMDRDMVVFIPYSLSPFMQVTARQKKPEIIYSRGLYFTGNSTGDSGFLEQISRFRDVGINTIVFDAKDVTGIVSYFSNVPDVLEYGTHEKRTIDDIDKLIRIFKRENIYTIARIAVFSDQLLCKKRPSLSIRSARTGGIWNPGSSEIWCDPTNKEVQDYNIDLAIELCIKGVDEIQFDYIRFPTLGDQGDAVYSYSFGRMSREETINHFLKRAYGEISARNTNLSIDIFGVVAWSKEVDIRKTGQRVESLARYCDVISPMLYPSHFNDDFDGFASPGDEPFYFIYKGCRKTDLLAGGRVIRPWLQAFKWRVTRYDENYIFKQIVGCREGGAFGYLFWNAKNDYDVVCRALEKLIAMKRKRELEESASGPEPEK